MTRDEATLAQIRAADPAASTWLSANAGSGKTRVLTDRVARLLLRGTDPQNILCLTYTKAAAAEMQNRLFRRLGEWAMLPDAGLRAALEDLGEDVPPEALARARILFAQAMEVPGGLRIQTIHAFCAGLLRRFPLEAGLNPDFSEMEDRAAALLRAEVADRMAEGPEQGLIDALLVIAGGSEIDPLLAEIAARADLFRQPFNRDALAHELGLQGVPETESLVRRLLGQAERDLIGRLALLCAGGSSTDIRAGERLRRITGRPEDLAVLESVFLTGAGAKEPFSAKIGSFPTKATRERAPDLIEELNDLMQAVEEARPQRLGALALDRAERLHDFARAYLARYGAAKSARGLLDFDDLIARALALLTRPEVAQWVLFKLDGGLDHILVDEAQDTSPRQWAVIRGLAQEFAAGEGARAGMERTIFVVGDEKQSIYSFQGADPQKFEEMRQHFGEGLAQVGRRLEPGALRHSFRSAPAILAAVDAVFAGENAEGLGAEAPLHRAFRDTMPGRVDLWPTVPKDDTEDEAGDWTDPVDRIGRQHHARVLSARIADRLREMVDHGWLAVDGVEGPVRRRITEGDILILVQRRSELFAALIRDLKLRGLKVAGADRLRIGAELAVKDIGALLRFLALAEDDLALAEALRSPLFGWSEQELFTLAARRAPGAGLWEALRQSGRTDTLEILNSLRDRSDFLRPYDLINQLLVRHGGRQRLLARLGPEAEDGIDALLAQALAYEQGGVPSLTGFVGWMQTDETDLKRQMESRGDSIRVMTVHGSKGLEAPIVILPDTAKREVRDRDLILDLGGLPIWPGAKDEATEAQLDLRAERRAADERERRRLLYVAMTRAESWLIVAAAGETGSGSDSWHSMAEAGLIRAGAAAEDHPTGPGLRLQNGEWEGTVAVEKQAPDSGIDPVLSDFPAVPPTPPGLPDVLSPSDLGGAKVLPGEIDPEAGPAAGDAARAQGRLVHRLLELLPSLPEERRAEVAESLVLGDPDLPLITEPGVLIDSAFRILASPDMVAVLAGGGLPEMQFTCPLPDGRRLSGSMDLVHVTPDAVTVIDYKSNRLVPAYADQVPEGILRQLGAYAHAASAIWPGRRIETAILWTLTGRLMPIPGAAVMAALQRALGPGGELDVPRPTP